MQKKKRSFDELFDIYGFRIIVQSVDECYRVLGIIHNAYKPIPGRFADYVAIPKANGYQSLHTVCIWARLATTLRCKFELSKWIK